MSFNLYWRPVKPTTAKSLPRDLKKPLAKRFFDSDGSLKGGPVTLTDKDSDYLEGLADAGVDGAEELIEAIRRHGAVEVYIDE
jgi:hypothetical protein